MRASAFLWAQICSMSQLDRWLFNVAMLCVCVCVSVFQQNGAFSFTDSSRVFSLSFPLVLIEIFRIKLYSIQSKPKFFTKTKIERKIESKTLSIVKIGCWDLFFSLCKPILTKRFLGCCCCCFFLLFSRLSSLFLFLSFFFFFCMLSYVSL